MTETPAQVDVAELRALLEAATPGPWVVDRTLGWDGVEGPDRAYVAEFGTRDDPNAAFIAAARNALPALLDEVEDLRAKVAAVEALADECADHPATAECADDDGWRCAECTNSRAIRAALETP